MSYRSCTITRDVVSLVHGRIAPAGATGVVVSYAQSGHDSRWGILFDAGQGVPLNGSGQALWPVDGWNVREEYASLETNHAAVLVAAWLLVAVVLSL